jgi:hypothetical protein
MKLLLIICPSQSIDDVRRIIDEHEVHTFTELDGLRGSGETGRRLGTRAYPGAVSMLFTALPEAKAEELVGSLGDLSRQCAESEGLRVFEMDVKDAI